MFTVVGGATISIRLDAESTDVKTDLIIDAHCHAGKGTEMAAPWSTFADPKVTFRRAMEAGIDKAIIFPINYPAFEKANLEIAEIIKQYRGKFIGFVKHDPGFKTRVLGKLRVFLPRKKPGGEGGSEVRKAAEIYQREYVSHGKVGNWN